MKWQELDDGRLHCEHAAGFDIIKPKDERQAVPLFCPVCEMAMLTSNDANDYRKHQCCERCRLRWVDVRREEWAQGWRPDSEQIENERQRRQARRPKLRF